MRTVARLMVFLLAVAQVAVIPLFFGDGFVPTSPGPEAPAGPIPLEPAGYAFSIWGFIYLGSLAYAVFQLRSTAPGREVLDRIAPMTAAAFAASTAWTVFASKGPLWGTAPLIIVMATGLVAALAIAARRTPGDVGTFQAFVLVPLGLYGGWVSVASFVNITDVLRSYGIVGSLADTGSLLYPAIAVIAVLAACQLVVVSRGTTAFAGAVAWALTAVVVANVTRDLSLAVALIAGLGVFAVLAAWGLARRWPSSV